jgi:hypothetical protein
MQTMVVLPEPSGEVVASLAAAMMAETVGETVGETVASEPV